MENIFWCFSLSSDRVFIVFGDEVGLEKFAWAAHGVDTRGWWLCSRYFAAVPSWAIVIACVVMETFKRADMHWVLEVGIKSLFVLHGRYWLLKSDITCALVQHDLA